MDVTPEHDIATGNPGFSTAVDVDRMRFESGLDGRFFTNAEPVAVIRDSLLEHTVGNHSEHGGRQVKYARMNSPVGAILIARNEEGITAIELQTEKRPPPSADWEEDASALADAEEQLREYFAGKRVRFDLPLAPPRTRFQRSVWDALVEIPYGETRSYRDIATRIGRPTASRAIGAANGRNPIAIVIPCHRVIGSSGSLTGYAGGLGIKQALLELERTTRWRREGRMGSSEDSRSDPVALATELVERS